MFHHDQYHLIDFGSGRKVEWFAGQVVQRETPSASGIHGGSVKHEFDLGYRQSTRKWTGTPPEPWRLKLASTPIKFDLRLAPSGQVGIFPEQAANWAWLLSNQKKLRGKKVLNLFGYTGGTSLVLAYCGCEVVHVDAASSVVKWARSNAEYSGLEESPIRWIVEDASRFVKREIKRGNRYDMFVADPPSFGRGPKGETWKIETDLKELIEDLTQLGDGRQPTSGLISCHSPGFSSAKLKTICQPLSRNIPVQAEPLELNAVEQTRSLPSGYCVRWLV